jgi:hypothetical protein
VNAFALHEELAAAGFSLRADGSQLIVTPADQLTDAHRSAIRAHKPELIEALTATRRRWLVQYPDGRVFSVTCYPPATLAEIQADHPGASIEPKPEPEPPAAEPLSPESLATVNDYLDAIGEDDPATRAEYIANVTRDPRLLAQGCRAALTLKESP